MNTQKSTDFFFIICIQMRERREERKPLVNKDIEVDEYKSPVMMVPQGQGSRRNDVIRDARPSYQEPTYEVSYCPLCLLTPRSLNYTNLFTNLHTNLHTNLAAAQTRHSNNAKKRRI